MDWTLKYGGRGVGFDIVINTAEVTSEMIDAIRKAAGGAKMNAVMVVHKKLIPGEVKASRLGVALHHHGKQLIAGGTGYLLTVIVNTNESVMDIVTRVTGALTQKEQLFSIEADEVSPEVVRSFLDTAAAAEVRAYSTPSSGEGKLKQ